MSILWMHDPITGEQQEVGRDTALPVEVKGNVQPPVAGQTITRIVTVPGIGTGSAYQAGDAFGTMITFPDVFRPEKLSGRIVSAFYIDRDDEGVSKYMPIYVRPITESTDNAAVALSLANAQACRGAVVIDTFADCAAFQIGVEANINLWVSGESPNLYTQLVTAGADNIAAGALPIIGIVVVPD